MAIHKQQIAELTQRADITPEDVAEFLRTPNFWHVNPGFSIKLAKPKEFWQGVYDDLDIKVVVPPLQKMTAKQLKSIHKFGFLLVYIPEITEWQYPTFFVRPACVRGCEISKIERIPLKGRWVAIETIEKPHNDIGGYPNDRLMAAVKQKDRFEMDNREPYLDKLLIEVARATNFPKKGTRLPTAEEWNFIANVFNWLREHREMKLPDLGSTKSWELCANDYDSHDRLVVGYQGYLDRGASTSGLSYMDYDWRSDRMDAIGFRVLAEL